MKAIIHTLESPPKGPRHDIKERNANIADMRRCGKSLREIANIYNISPENVRQIAIKEERLRNKFFEKHNPSRVIDMGGDRDCVVEWTPEMQAKEFDLLRGEP
jgi:hypothetical protein